MLIFWEGQARLKALWPGDPAPRFTRVSSIDRGDPCNTTALEMSAHTATHIDAPRHFIDGGLSVDAIALEASTAQRIGMPDPHVLSSNF